MLSDAFDQAGNVVLISKLLQKKTTMQAGLVDHYDSLEYSDEIFNRFAHHGFANVMTNADNELDVKECRSIISQMEVNEKKNIVLLFRWQCFLTPQKLINFWTENMKRSGSTIGEM